MSEHYDFHYQPTGSGAISGQQVLEQTEDAINELGDYVNDNVGGAMDVAQQALETAQNAEQDAQTALDTANSFSSAIQSAQQDASTALSTAQTAQNTASNANNTAIQAQQDASSAVTTANNASGQVSTLSGTVTTLGQRVTTAEGNIGQNTSDITALTTRVGTAEGNITTLQNDVTIAQGNASSAMATAGQVKQQAFVFRYSSTALVASSTNSNTLLDNTDNLKVGDKVIDSSGVLFSITAIDTANSTFTVGSALIDLALDANVVHTSGNETVGGNKTFSSDITLQGTTTPVIKTISNIVQDSTGYNGSVSWVIRDKDNLNNILESVLYKYSAKSIDWQLKLTGIDNGVSNSKGIRFTLDPVNNVASFISIGNNNASLGNSSTKWNSVYATEYYYGSNNVEFSTKFVTTDTAQTISGNKTFSSNVNVYNSDTSASTPNFTLRSSKSAMGTSDTDNQGIFFNDKNNDTIASLRILNYTLNGSTYLTHTVNTKDTNNQNISASTSLYILNNGRKVFRPNVDNDIFLGYSLQKWKDVNTYLVNGLTPSSLSLPDLSNGIDISSYITVNGGNKESLYTPPANGWISVALTRTSGSVAVMLKQGNLASSGHRIDQENGTATCNAMLPVKGGVQVSINSALASSVVSAYFYPCLGNV